MRRKRNHLRGPARLLLVAAALVSAGCPPPQLYDRCQGDADCPRCHRCDPGVGLCIPVEPCEGATCIDGVCCSGCWLADRCEAGDADQACGAGGAACAVCPAGSHCHDGACQWPPVRAISASSTSSCALRHDGSVWCWGASLNSPLGAGMSNGLTALPRRVVRGDRHQGLGDIVTLRGAPANHCALDAEGAIWCWGDGLGDQLGTGSTADALRAVAVQDASGATLHGFTTFDLHYRHACGLRGQGEVWCWGHNDYGQLGRGEGAPAHIAHPVEMLGPAQQPLRDAAEVAVGSLHTCVLRRDGAVWCTGFGSNGQLGSGDFESRALPGEVLTTEGTPLAAAVELDCGSTSCCARLGDGSVRCWGSGNLGQLGQGEAVNSSTAVVVRDLPEGRALALGPSAACALTRAGELWCWGDNTGARLGEGTFAQHLQPVRALLDAVDSPPWQVALGNAHTLLLDENGGLWGWGQNQVGQLAVPVAEQDQLMLPQALPGLPAEPCAPVAAAAVAASGRQTCAVAVDGRAWCWGPNESGALGTGLSDYLAWTTQPVVREEAGPQATGFAEITSGFDARHTCARRQDGTAWCWGYGYQGQLGNGYTHVSAPTQVLLAEATPLVDVVQVAAAGDHSCATLASGQARCWGFNDLAQLGNGRRGTNQPWPGPVLVDASTTLQHVAAVVTGHNHSCARLDDGQVRCWGKSGSGETGSGSTVTALYPVPVRTDASTPLDEVQQLAAGDRFTCAVQQGGALWCWGENGLGQLGDGGSEDGLFARRSALALGPVTRVAAGGDHACAIAADASLWCWGGNTFGQLGDGSTVNSRDPVQVLRAADTPLTDVAQVVAGLDVSCAIDGSGGLWCWGANQSGQLASPLDTPLSPWALPVALGCP